jgi:hypothetical protein
MTHTHHTHFVHYGTHKAAIVTAEHEDGSVDLVYFNGGSDGTPHAAVKVKHDLLGSDGSFHHHHEHAETLSTYAHDSEKEQAAKEAKAEARRKAVANAQSGTPAEKEVA